MSLGCGSPLTVSLTYKAQDFMPRAGVMNYQVGGFGAKTPLDSALRLGMDITDGLLFWWKLNELSGSSANDSSGNGNTGTVRDTSNVAQNGNWLGDNGIGFNAGTCNKVNAGGSGVASLIKSGPISASVWVNANAIAGVQVLVDNGKFQFRISNTGGLAFSSDNFTTQITFSLPLVNATWYNVGCTRDAGGFGQIFINGVFRVSGKTGQPTTPAPAGSITCVGSSAGGGNSFSGDMADARVYTRVLSAAEFATIYQVQGGWYDRIAKFDIRGGDTGSLTFVGNLNKFTTRALNAALTFVGNLQNQTQKALSAALTFIGNLSTTYIAGGGTTHFQSLTASLSFVGGFAKQTNKALSAALTFVGAINNFTSRTLSAALTFTGNLTKLTSYPLVAASLTFSGNLVKMTKIPLAAALTFSGSLIKSTLKSLSAALTFVGNVIKLTSRSLVAASLGFTGALTKMTLRAFSAALTFVGNLQTQLNHAGTHFLNMSSSLSFVGNLTKQTNYPLAAALTFVGAVTKQTNRLLAASAQFTGSIVKQTGNALSASLSFVGNLNRRTSRALSAALSFSGAFVKTTFIPLVSASLSFSGSFVKRCGKSMSAAANFAGSLVKRTARGLGAALSFAGNLATQYLSGGSHHYQLALNASLSFVGSVKKKTVKSLPAALTFVGSLVSVFWQHVLLFLNAAYQQIIKQDSSATCALLLDKTANMQLRCDASATIQVQGTIRQ